MILGALNSSPLTTELSSDEITQYNNLITDGCYDQILPETLSNNNTWAADTFPPKKQSAKAIVIIFFFIFYFYMILNIIFRMKNMRPYWIHSSLA